MELYHDILNRHWTSEIWMKHLDIYYCVLEPFWL